MKPSPLSAAAAIALATSALAQEPKVLTEWDIQTQPAGIKVIQEAQARFEKANPDFKVQRTQIPNDAYKTKLKIAMGANEPPCVFMNWGGGILREYVKAGQIVDLTPYLAKDAGFRERFLRTAFDATTSQGKTYGLPGENTAGVVIYYNTEIFAKFGLTPPRTWPELLKVVEALKAKDVAPFALANKAKWPGSMYYMYLVDRIGGPDVFRKAIARAPGGSFADPVFVEAGKRLQELVKAGAFAQGFNGLDYDVGASRRLLYSGKAAMELMGTWESSSIRNENPEFMKKVDFFPFPTVPGGKGQEGNVVGSVGNNFYSISTACKTPDAAYKLITTMVDDASVKARLADNRLVPLKDLPITDPTMQRVMKLVADAPAVQLWYDQELPPQLAELHKDTVQAMFGLSITPEEAAQKMEALAAQVLK
ncbi:carbohydrate ABC transporter substrate-binding protein, CUT1 family [Variovorax sp. HW608]|uniref:extracellular solute-binding protein n=1 Tax=Variovorax sp. HW608 TaxID=1034889 RepID=UPI00081FE975|nr:extracellular solute-binding protein [Variovorax sp. HW608]SCK15264.1 carbohydrate ABC transporter substrate-binding protein, CUT1 family [Variovorax sp. HW608]